MLLNNNEIKSREGCVMRGMCKVHGRGSQIMSGRPLRKLHLKRILKDITSWTWMGEKKERNCFEKWKSM